MIMNRVGMRNIICWFMKWKVESLSCFVMGGLFVMRKMRLVSMRMVRFVRSEWLIVYY